jgi:hypothetical protein
LSATGLGYEVALTRILSIAEWHHFAYMIISVALLGFAASGTVVALLGRRLDRCRVNGFRAGALVLVVALPGSNALVQAIPFETFELLVRPGQWGWLCLLYGVLAIPFFFVSWCILLGFLIESDRVGRVYFASLLGSGLGAVGVVGLMLVAPPSHLASLLTILVVAAFLLSLSSRSLIVWLAGLGVAGLAAALIGAPAIRVSQYKGLSYALDLPDARVVETVWSPLSVLTAVSSTYIRETPGQIAGYPMHELGELPEQAGLYFDADAVSPVHRFDGSLDPFAFLDYVTSALPYQALERPRTLVIGAGGGTEVLNALQHGASHVTALELDPNVFRLVNGALAEFSGGLYSRPEVTPVVAEGRGWLEGNDGAPFDLIQISLLDSFNASAAGVRAVSESYLYTIEAVGLYLNRLSRDGVLAITRWLRTPPRDAIKMFATLVETAERAGIDDPGRHLAMVRSWNTATLLLSRSPLSAERVRAIRVWADTRGFDLSWLPGLEASEVNRFTILDEPVYWEAARLILAPGAGVRERFYADYPFHVRPATDDRPHFFRFFKWTSLRRLVESVRLQWTNVVEWGYLVVVGTVVQATVAALLIVLLPLGVVLWLGRRRAKAADSGDEAERPRTHRVILYFSAIGLAYLFLELAFIQKLILFLHHPVYAVAVVLSAFLIFSGLGSAVADRYVGGVADRHGRGGPGESGKTPRRLVGGAVLLIAIVMIGYLVLLPGLFSTGGGWPDPARILMSLGVLAPVAFLMGVPFPTALQVVSGRRQELVPWAWAVNGAASVMAPPVAVLVAIHWGFTAVVGLAVALYVGAYAVFRDELPD